MLRIFPLIAALVLTPALARSAEQAAQKKPLTAEVMWQLSRLGPPSISPDGKWAALAVTTYEVKAVHGGLDYRVPDSNGFELFNILQNRSVKSTLVYYPNENHWVLKPQNSLFWYETTRQWLRDFIGEGPDAKPAPHAAAQ